MGIYACISAFVMIGLEHSIANLFLVPLGKLAGAEVSIADDRRVETQVSVSRWASPNRERATRNAGVPCVG